MNKPYVKQYNEKGIITNPLTEDYLNEDKNRRERRSILAKKRFHGESKNYHLSVMPNAKYHRVRQLIECRDPKTEELTGEIRTIEHYILS